MSKKTLPFYNKFIFAYLMRKNPDLCKRVVETILDVKIRKIIRIDSEDTLETNATGRGVRLDVYLEDDDAIYDIEMQTADEGNLRNRSRYYQGILDTDYLEKGADYNDLKNTYVIFICKFDIFGEGLCKYTFTNMCREIPGLELDDGAIKVFINATSYDEKVSPELRELAKYIDDGTVTGHLSKTINDRVEEVNSDERVRMMHMTYEWELASQYRKGEEVGFTKGEEAGFTKGEEAGRQEERKSILELMVGRISDEELKASGFSIDEIDAAKHSKSKAKEV